MKTKAIAAIMIMLSLASMLVAKSAATSALFTDDFEDGAAEGWTVVNPRGPEEDPSIIWVVEQDQGTWVYSGEGGGIWGGGDAVAYAGDLSWTDYSIQARVKIVEARNPGSHHAIIGRFQDAQSYYEFGVWGRWSEGAYGLPRIMLIRGWQTPESDVIAFKTEEEMGALGIPVPIMWNTWYTFKMVFQGDRIMCYFDGILVFDVTDTTYQNGCIGLINGGGHTHFDDVQVLSYPPTIPVPGVPEFGLGVAVMTSLAAIIYLLIKRKALKPPYIR